MITARRAAAQRATGRKDRRNGPRVIVPKAVLMVILLILAFMSLLPGDSPLASGFTPSRALEMGLTAAAAAVGMLARLQHQNRKLPPMALIPILALVIFSLWALFTTLWAPLVLIGMGRALQLMMIIFAVYCIASLTQPEPGRIAPEAFVNSAALGMMICVLILLATNVGLFGTPFPMESDPFDAPFATNLRPRFFLAGSHPLKTASFLSVTILFVLASSLRRDVMVVVLAGLAALLIMTDGRTAMAATGVGVLLRGYLLMRPSPIKVLLGLVVAVGTVGGVAIAIAFSDMSTMLSTAIGEDVFTLNGRVALWEYALDAWADHPVAGVGYYNTRIVLLDAFPFAGHTHNSLLEIMLGTGLPGLFLSLVFLASCIHALARTGDQLLGGVLVITIMDGALNPVLFAPGIGQTVLLLSVPGACLTHQPRRVNRASAPARPASGPLPGGRRISLHGGA